ncbi:hypothetical protein LOAG_12563 [Loa loa]|uniref:Uncharacterized protein n=1 Tax=Loa loa TaxID=7209 RepID=A0A1S0TL02_LOALO|nr:hypothetical protein LOAG_12563 [Loa loa]EFO15947.2 hypothetical protein LOAG_12563 [Loa loa]
MEDINDDLSYMNCRLLVPSSIFAAISLTAFLIGSILGHFYDIKRRDDGNMPSWLFASGWYSKYCSNLTSTMIPNWYLPSILRLLELTVQANVSFRIATCIPTSLRLFQSYLNALVNANICPYIKKWFWYRWCNIAVPILLFLKFSSAHFSLSIPFVKIIKRIDQICVIIKLLCLIAFGIVTPQVTIFHNSFIDSPACHYYVPPYQALCEYILIISNASFHLTMITDTRNLRFLIYPRTCSGECEPINPENFRKGGKFEHCRSQYHINKKRLMIGDGNKMQETTF